MLTIEKSVDVIDCYERSKNTTFLSRHESQTMGKSKGVHFINSRLSKLNIFFPLNDSRFFFLRFKNVNTEIDALIFFMILFYFSWRLTFSTETHKSHFTTKRKRKFHGVFAFCLDNG